MWAMVCGLTTLVSPSVLWDSTSENKGKQILKRKQEQERERGQEKERGGGGERVEEGVKERERECKIKIIRR